MNRCLRPAAVDDLEAVRTLVRDAYAPHEERMGQKPGPMLDDYDVLIRRGLVWVADLDGRVGGLLVLVNEGPAMLLDNVAVAPAAQGTGLGRWLLAHAERIAREAGCSSIRLYTHETMTENIALYARLGYVETHRGEEKGFSRVYMSKVLDSG